MVVDKDSKAEYREVALGVSIEGMRVVTGGLHAGERIVVKGLQRVRLGALVAPEMVAWVLLLPRPRCRSASILISVLLREHRANTKNNRSESVRSITVGRAGTLALRSPATSETVS